MNRVLLLLLLLPTIGQAQATESRFEIEMSFPERVYVRADFADFNVFLVTDAVQFERAQFCVNVLGDTRPIDIGSFRPDGALHLSGSCVRMWDVATGWRFAIETGLVCDTVYMTSGRVRLGSISFLVLSDDETRKDLDITIGDCPDQQSEIAISREEGPIVYPADGSATISIHRTMFVRGDSNMDGLIDISDAINILYRLFLTGFPFECPNAADANDDDKNDIADAIHILDFLFEGGLGIIPPPFPSTGYDPTPGREENTGCGWL